MSSLSPSGISSRPVSPARPVVQTLKPSLIRTLANQAIGQKGVIPLWFGEPDKATPHFIREVAKKALDDEQTFYQPNLGIAPLRQAIAEYMNGLYGTGFGLDNIVVTGSGMLAVQLAGQCIISPGDTIVTHVPTWPNLPATQRILGANIARVPLIPHAEGWQLDLDQLFDACTDKTSALLINSPGNPTGFMLNDDEQRAILDFCRQRGLWLIADEVYNRIVYNGHYAPTFADKITEDDRVLIINSFSKAWAMTGWRLGWITAPKSLATTFEMLTEYTNSCTFGATQLAGIAALQQGEDFIKASNARYKAALDLILSRFENLPRVFCPMPQAAFYVFFAVDGMTDSHAFAQLALEETQVGLAPGLAFGPEGESYLRVCFAKETELLAQALDRLEPLLQ